MTVVDKKLGAHRKIMAAQAAADALDDLALHASDEACGFLRGFSDALMGEARDFTVSVGSNTSAKGDGWDTVDQLGLLGAADRAKS